MADELFDALASVQKKYPRLSGTKWDAGYGNSNDNRQIEFYPPDEAENPHRGSPYLEVYNKALKGPSLESALFGDMLHYQPVIDPEFSKMRTQFSASMTPQQNNFNQRRYAELKAQGKESRPFDQWMNKSQLDAYIRGYIAPDAADEWRKQKVYTPDQIKILNSLSQLLNKSR